METVTVTPKFQVVIPKSVRKLMDIRAGEKVVMFEKNGIIRMVKLGNVGDLKGRFRGISAKGLRDEDERSF